MTSADFKNSKIRLCLASLSLAVFFFTINACTVKHVPVQFGTIVNGRPNVYMGHHVKEEEKDELGNFMSISFVKRQYIKMWLQHLPSR